MEHESRSEAHRRAKRLEAVGKQLIGLTPGQLDAAPLDDTLREAVIAARKMTRAALRRQTLFIGGLLRDLEEEEIAPIVDFVEEGKKMSRAEAQHHALLEHWRDRLLEEGEPAVNELVESHPTADRQQVRQLLRTAAKESERNKPPAAARKLFKYLRELLADDDVRPE